MVVEVIPIYTDFLSMALKQTKAGPRSSGTPFLVLPEFVSYSGERGMLFVGNGSHFYTPVLNMNMCHITFKVLRLSTFVLRKKY